MTSYEVRFPGLREVARVYWQGYSKALMIGTLGIAILGGLSIGISLTSSAVSVFYTLLAMLGLIIHLAAFMLRDVWTGELNNRPDDHTWTELSVLTIVVSTYINMILIAGAASATRISESSFQQIAIFAAIYIPVFDFYLLRKTGWSPGGLVIRGGFQLIHVLGLVRDTSIEQLPMIGHEKKPRRPRFG